MSGLVAPESFCQVSEHRENLSKRTDLYSALRREQHSFPRKTASQDLRHYSVFQLFGNGKSALGVIVLAHSNGSSPSYFVQPGRDTGLTLAITPTPSENIIDLYIKRAMRLINKIPCMLTFPAWFWRPDTFFPVQASVTCWTVLAVTTS